MLGRLKNFLLRRRGWGSPSAPVEEAIEAEEQARNLDVGRATHLRCKAAQIYFYNDRHSDFDRMMNILQSDSTTNELVRNHLENTGYMHFVEGKRRDAKDRLEDAIVQYLLALRFASDSSVKARVYSNLGYDYGLQGKLDQELECYEKSVELNPRHMQAQSNLIVTYLERGREDDARSFLAAHRNMTNSEIDTYISRTQADMKRQN